MAKTSSVPQSEAFPAPFCFPPSFLLQVSDLHLARGSFSPNATLLTPLPFTSSPREPLTHLIPSQCLPPGNPNTAQGSVITLSFRTETLRDCPGGPEAKSACSQCREPKFNPWSGNSILPDATKDPSCHNEDQRSCMLQRLAHHGKSTIPQ